MTSVKFPATWLCAALLVGAALVAGEPQQETDKDYTSRMAAEHADDKPVASPAADKEAAAEVTTERVTYARVGDREVKGFLAKPKDAQGRPGIIVIHEWWGLNENIESMAQQLAAAGYVALAVDLYGGEVAETPDAARQLMSTAMADGDPIDENLRQAHANLTDKQGAPKVGSIGWCFGGSMSLRTAILLPDQIDGAVIYYGRLSTDRDALSKLSMPVLGLFGEADRGIPVDKVNEFGATMKELGKDARIHIYPGASHAFANPSGTRYDAEAAEDAWQKTLAFFEETLAG